MAHPIRLALIGIGKIARDQHLPAIAADPGFTLVAAVSRNATVDGTTNFHDIDALIASGTSIDAVSIATPPVGRHAIATTALAAGWHVMLEKPPGSTLGEVGTLIDRTHDLTLYATWHSRAAAAVDPARAWLLGKTVTGGHIRWREDIRKWHPGQDWILAPGGFGVFDPGINALSIVTAILPRRLRLDAANLVIPRGRGAAIAATLTMLHDTAAITADFDFRQQGPQSWDITIETTDGTLTLHNGGTDMAIDGTPHPVTGIGEYPALYRHFAELIASGQSNCDLTPLELVADAHLLGSREEAEAFEF